MSRVGRVLRSTDGERYVIGHCQGGTTVGVDPLGSGRSGLNWKFVTGTVRLG